jgi:hypothetical protein
LALLPSACSPASSEAKAAPSAEALAIADCERIATCLPTSLQIVYGDEATCRSRQTLSAAASLALAKDADTGACADALRAMSCDEYVNLHGSPAACRFRGAVANGSACGTDWECSSGFCSFVDACGKCAEAPNVMHGGSGAACDSGNDCEATLSCVAGKCVARAAAGEPCGVDRPECQTDLYCGGGNVCSLPKLAALGDACGAIGGELVFCKGGYCKGGVKGTCAPFTADGQACGTGFDTCQPPASCVDGNCRLPDPAKCE